MQPSSKYFSSHNILPNLSESQTVWNPSPVLFILKLSWSKKKLHWILYLIWQNEIVPNFLGYRHGLLFNKIRRLFILNCVYVIIQLLDFYFSPDSINIVKAHPGPSAEHVVGDNFFLSFLHCDQWVEVRILLAHEWGSPDFMISPDSHWPVGIEQLPGQSGIHTLIVKNWKIVNFVLFAYWINKWMNEDQSDKK